MEIFKHDHVWDFMSVRKYWIGFSILAVLHRLQIGQGRLDGGLVGGGQLAAALLVQIQQNGA